MPKYVIYKQKYSTSDLTIPENFSGKVITQKIIVSKKNNSDSTHEYNTLAEAEDRVEQLRLEDSNQIYEIKTVST